MCKAKAPSLHASKLEAIILHLANHQCLQNTAQMLLHLLSLPALMPDA